MTHDAPARFVEGGASTPEENATAGLLLELPNTGPDEETLDRIWVQVQSPRRAMSWSTPLWRWSGAALCLALALATVRWRLAESVELVLATGPVTRITALGSRVATQPGVHVRTGERLQSGSTAALLRLPSTAALLLSAQGEVSFDRLENGTHLTLWDGMLTARVTKRAPSQPFEVTSGRYTVCVVGTIFSVEHGATGVVSVSVREGAVDVLADGTLAARVSAGERWTSDPLATAGRDATPDGVVSLLNVAVEGAAPEALAPAFQDLMRKVRRESEPATPRSTLPAIAPPTPAVAEGPVPRESRRVRSTAETPRSVPTAAPAAHAEESPPPTPARTVPSIAEPAGLAPVLMTIPLPVVEAPQSRPAPSPVPTPSAPPLPRESQADAPSTSTGPAKPVVAPEPPRLTLDDADRLMKERRYLEAARLYEVISERHATIAKTALLDLGSVCRRELTDLPRALRAYLAFRERYPGDALSEVADAAIFELRRGGPDATVVLAEATRYLQMYPQGAHAAEIRFARAELHRERGEWKSAIEDYSGVAREPRLGDDASYAIAMCQERIGDLPAVATSLRVYLSRYPGGRHAADARAGLDRR